VSTEAPSGETDERVVVLDLVSGDGDHTETVPEPGTRGGLRGP
jgi:hypothetical protein